MIPGAGRQCKPRQHANTGTQIEARDAARKMQMRRLWRTLGGPRPPPLNGHITKTQSAERGPQCKSLMPGLDAIMHVQRVELALFGQEGLIANCDSAV
jgi:hypothetical protein